MARKPYQKDNNRKNPLKTLFTTLLIVVLLAGIVVLGLQLSNAQSSPIKASDQAKTENSNNQSHNGNGKRGMSRDTISSDSICELTYVNIPKGMPSQIVEYDGFTVSFNKDNRTPNYVSWELLSSETDGHFTRSDEFRCDTLVNGCPSSEDYRHSGYDRGHLYPAADAKWSKASMQASFSMANMTPQTPELNRQTWKTLEEKERHWAKRDGRLIIVAGPIYEGKKHKKVGTTDIQVPEKFFKVLLAPDVTPMRAIGFVYNNTESGTKERNGQRMKSKAMSIDEVESITGFDFFYKLPDKEEKKVESNYSIIDWGIQ